MNNIELNCIAHTILSFRNKYYYRLRDNPKDKTLIPLKRKILTILRNNSKLQKEFDKIVEIDFSYDFTDRQQIVRTIWNKNTSK